MIYIVVFIVCFAIAVALLSGSRLTGSNKPSDNDLAMQMEYGASFGLSADKASYSPGEEIVVTLTGDTKGTEITGYDALVQYDPEYLEVVRSTSSHDFIDVYPHTNDDYVSLTGVKRITETGKVIFDGSDVATIVFTAKKSGVTALSVLSEVGREKSKVVDMNAQIIPPYVGTELAVTIQ